jgi:putative transposase
VKKAFKYRLYVTAAQSEQLDWTLTRCCELYNAALQERKDAWDACKRHPNFYDPAWRKERTREYSVNYYDQANALPELKSEIRPEYQQIGAHVLQEVLRRVDKTFQAFFRRVRAGATPGYPRFQSRARYESFCFPDHAGWKLTGNRLTLTNIGSIRLTFA